MAAHARRQGVARQLLERLESELTARGRTVMIADVWRDAVGFYESLGWAPRRSCFSAAGSFDDA